MRIADIQLAQRTSRLALLAVFALALTGCQIVASSNQYTQIRFIAASPDAPGLDVFQNGLATLYNVGFGVASSYIAVTPASYTYSVDVAGTRQQLAAVGGVLALGAQYTVLIGNVTASMQMSLLKDQSAPSPSGQVAFRFLDQSTRLGAVDIYLVPANGALATTSPILTKVGFNNAPAYLDVPSGAYSIVVLPAGTGTQTTTTTTTTTTGTTTTTTTTGSTVAALYSGNQIIYPGASARTVVLIDQPLSTPAAFQVITADDYDSPSATT
jgi:hypothetical protein